MSDIIIGILLVISFFFMVWYCVKGYNLMVGFAIMATVWMGLALVGNTFSPNPAMEGQGVIDVLTHIYTTGPAEYAKSILVNVFFGAFFGRVLVDSGIAATLIRKVVELGGQAKNHDELTMYCNRCYIHVDDRNRTSDFYCSYCVANLDVIRYFSTGCTVLIYGLDYGWNLC